MSGEAILSMLRDEYLAATAEKKRKRDEITAKHREVARKNAELEAEAMSDAVDMKLAGMLVRALESGLKRADIWKPVFGTNDNDRWRRLIELGGGEVRAKRTGEEIIAQAVASAEAEKRALFDRLGVLEDFVNDRGFPSFRFEVDIWGYVDTDYWRMLAGYGDDFDVDKWSPFVKSHRAELNELIEYVKKGGTP